MASRSAMVLVIFIVSVLAFCFAGAFAAMTGTYHLNLDFGILSSQPTITTPWLAVELDVPGAK